MPDLPSRAAAARFGPYAVDLRTGELLKDGRRIRLPEKPFQILATLLENPGELVSREELRRRLWPDDTFVDFDHALGNALNRLRQALNDSAESPRYIETLPKRGFRLIVPAELRPAPSEPGAKAQALPRSPRIWKVAIVSAVGVTLIVAVIAWRQFAVVSPGRALLVVLPFENLSGDANQEIFCDGMTEEMIAQLGKLDPGQLAVIGRLSAMQYKGRAKGIPQIGNELGVDYVLEGSVRRERDRQRITVRLLRVRDQVQLWSQNYEREADNLLAVQTDVALGVARAIRMRLTPQQRALLATEQPVSAEAREAYLRGRHFFDKFSSDGLGRAIKHLNLALEKEPNYALAQSWLAASYALLGHFGVVRPQEAYGRCRELAAKGIENGPALAEPHTEMGLCTMFIEHDWVAAERELKTAIQLNPNSPLAHYGYYAYLLARGNFDDALAEIEHARALDPLSLIINCDLGWLHFAARRYPQAEAQLKKTLELDPSFPVAYLYLNDLYERMGRDDQAFDATLELTRLTGGAAQIPDLRRAFLNDGLKGVRRHSLQQMKQQAQSHYIPPQWIALAHISLGEKDQALAALEQAYDERQWSITLLKIDPRLDSLRGDPRFEELLKKTKLN